MPFSARPLRCHDVGIRISYTRDNIAQVQVWRAGKVRQVLEAQNRQCVAGFIAHHLFKGVVEHSSFDSSRKSGLPVEVRRRVVHLLW